MGDPSNRDNDLASRTCGGDHAAFRLLVERYRDQVVRIAFRIANDFHAAEDIAQDSFVRAFGKISQFDPDKGSFSSWLFTITKNVSLNARRKRNPIPIETAGAESCDRPDPAGNSESRDQYRQLDAAIDELEEPFRSTFLLAEVEELPLKQIAEMEGAALGTIKSRISRAKSRLREALKPSQP